MRFIGFPSAAALAAPALLAAMPAQASDKYLGEIFVMPGSYCPQGSTEADGKLLPIASFQALYSILGTSYGGDGPTTFALPDLRPNREAFRQGFLRYCVMLVGDYPVRS